MPPLPNRPTWIEVDRSALVNNVFQLRRLLSPNCRLMAVVKANAYGHGLAATADVLGQAGADQFAVAMLSEAIELRQQGIEKPILVLGYTPPWLIEQALQYKITLTLFDLPTSQAFNSAAEHANQVLSVHVKLNTGMNRLGAAPEQTIDLFAHLCQLPFLVVEGVFTHFATSDLLDKSFAWQQFATFTTLLQQLEKVGLRPRLAHAANSAAIFSMPSTHLDMVRSGIALYGLHPDPDETPLPSGFLPALSWKAIVAHVTTVQPGESVSYGREFVANRPTTVAVIPVGYADGFPRKPFTYGKVLIHGCYAPIIGRVCMDQTMLDVTEFPTHIPVRQGDEVVLIGKQGQRQITVEDVATSIHTNNYDTVSRILGRVPRLMVGGSTLQD